MADRQVTARAALYQCKSCEGEFSADAFYVSSPTKCKECVKSRVRANRAEKADYYQSYDRMRYRESEQRRDAARKSSKSPAGIASRERYAAKGKGSPERAARIAVGNAIRDGRLERGEVCFFCSTSTALQAHHPDYSKPFDVFWLCPSCHGKLHTINGDFLRKGQKSGAETSADNGPIAEDGKWQSIGDLAANLKAEIDRAIAARDDGEVFE